MDLKDEILKEIELTKASVVEILQLKKALATENLRLTQRINALELEIASLRKENKSAKEKEKFATFAQHLSKSGVKKESLIKNLDLLIEKMDVYLNQITSKTGE